MPSEANPHETSGASPGDRAREAVKEQAGAIWQDAKQTAKSKLGEQKRSAAGGIHDVADALRTSARDLENKDQRTVARLANGAADGLQHLSSTLERRDLDELLRDAQSLARRRPAVFFGAALAAGFVAVRFMKSTEPAPR